MTCHLCEKSAIGLCRQCYKFYCREHGDGFCSECQQLGWGIEKHTTSHSFLEITAKQGSNAILTSSSSSATLNRESLIEPGATLDKEPGTETGQTPEKEIAADQEKPRPVAAWTTGINTASGQTSPMVGGVDYYRLEEITDPANFISLLPAFGISRVHDVLMLLRGIDIYREGFGVELTMRFGPKMESDTVTPHFHLGPHELMITDDVGTQYTLHGRGGGGGNHEWSQRYVATPALNPEAKTLTITVPRIQFMEHRSSRRSKMQPEQTYLAGPWIITSSIPPREQGIS
jgi:hypothetical protein